MKQQIFVTALPNGLSKAVDKPVISFKPESGLPLNTQKPVISTTGEAVTCRASIAFNLQVEQVGPNTKLSDLPDMLHWAERIRSANYTVMLDGKEIPCQVVSPEIDTHLWGNLFRPTVKVKSFVSEDLSVLPIASYPVKHILSHIRDVVTAFASTYTNDLPDADTLIANEKLASVSDYNIGKLPENNRKPISMEQLVGDKRSGQHLKDRLKKNGAIPFSQNPSPVQDFAQLKNFHGVYDFKNGKPFQQVQPPDFEFHDILSALSAYPQLLRRLGLVVDIEFQCPGLGTMKRKDTWANTIRIIPQGVDFQNPTTFICSATAYKLTHKGFYPSPSDSSVQDLGHLKLNSSAFTVFQLDTDGGALKLCQQSDALMLKKARHLFYASEAKLTQENLIPLLNNEAPRKEALPSQRTTGIGIARNGLASVFHQHFKATKNLRSSLFDSIASPTDWVGNQCSWVISKTILHAEEINIGFRMDVQTEDHPDKWFSLHKRNNHYAYLNSSGDEVPLPEFGADEGYIQTSVAEEVTETGPVLKVGEAIARWEGWSLSVPRPGSSLNDPKLDTQEIYDKRQPGGAIKELAKYKTPANADFRLNVKSGPVKGSLPMLRFGKRYNIRLRTVDLAGNSVALEAEPENPQESVVQNIRYLRYEPVDAPFLVLGTPVRDGESSEHLVIRSNEGVSVGDYEKSNIDSKHTKALPENAIRHVKPPRTTVEMATTHGMLEAAFGPSAASAALEIYKKITQEKDPAITQDVSYVMELKEGSVEIPVEYLADPMAAGVCFYLSADDPNPKLPDPQVLTRRVSFYFNDEVKDEATANLDADYATWMQPRSFRIELREGAPDVKWIAKQRMLQVTLQKGAMVKINYACFWRPKDLLRLSGMVEMLGLSNFNSSLGKHIAVGQHWLFSPWRTLTLVHAIQQPLSEVGGQKYPVIDQILPAREFGATSAFLHTRLLAHGPSTGQLDIEASWKEWIDDVENPKGVKVTGMQSKVVHFTTPYLVFDYRFGNTANNNPFNPLQHVFPDTKHRKVNYKCIATTRYRENFYQLIADAEANQKEFPITRESPTVESVIIPSSARPLPPQVQYVIPTFEWERNTTGKKTVSARISGLRVYLKRPWYSSGEGEQLAVVLAIHITDYLSTHGATVTTWGTDPTKVSAELPNGIELGLDQWPENGISQSDIGLTTAENPTTKVGVAAYDVKYDPERELYYVDIMLKPVASYYPFVRLALARYQRNSIRTEKADCCLSPVVQAEYIQIPAPRASFIELGGTHNIVTVAVSGNQPKTGNRAFFQRAVRFVVEPIEIVTSNGIHFDLGSDPIDRYEHPLSEQETAQFAFMHSHTFQLPSEYATKPYRIKIEEYELIVYDPLKPNPNPGGAHYATMPMKERLVYADVYEVNVK